MQPDKIKIEKVNGNPQVMWIRVDGVTRTQAQWRTLPSVTVSRTGMRKRVAAGWKPKDVVFKPSRGNAATVASKVASKVISLGDMSFDEVIREHYPAGGSMACLPYLVGVTRYQVASRANRIGVKVANLPEFCKTRAQNLPPPVAVGPDNLTRRPWLPLAVVRWVDDVTA